MDHLPCYFLIGMLTTTRRFRWVDCQLDALRMSLSPASIRRALKSLPKTLDETYDRILGSIEEDYRSAAHAALQWLAFSARPLSLEQIIEVVAVQQSGGKNFVEDRLTDPKDILRICSSLVTLPEDSRSSSNVIYLAHFSVKEYLTSTRILGASAPAFAISEIPANKIITEICLSYLSYFDKPNSLPKERRRTYPLLEYAAEYWYKHARNANEEMGLDSLIVEFLDHKESSSLQNWVRIRKPETDYAYTRGFAETPSSPLYYMSFCGLPKSAAVLIGRGVDVNAQGGYYGNALQAASAQQDNLEVIKLLLEAGADVNAQGGDYGYALQAASAQQDNIAVIKLLLEAGAFVDAQGGRYGNALRAASAQQNNTTVIKLLLEAGADVNAQGGLYGNALQAASNRRDNLAVIKLLLEAGANVNAQGGVYGNALQAASVQDNNIAVIKLLLDAGPDINAQGGYRGNALQAAAHGGDKASFEILLQHGAVITQEGNFDSAWEAATYGAFEAGKRWASVRTKRGQSTLKSTIFLLLQDIPYPHQEPRNRHAQR